MTEEVLILREQDLKKIRDARTCCRIVSGLFHEGPRRDAEAGLEVCFRLFRTSDRPSIPTANVLL